MNSKSVNNDNILHLNKNGIEYIQFKSLKKHENIVVHCFTTRKGGISENECESLNLGFNRKDKRENVEENFRRIGNCIGIDTRNMVFSNQVHDSKIKQVDENDRGKGIWRDTDIIGYDGLITNKREVALVTFYADCVPVFLLDPVKKVISLVHSGWRGTVKQIARQSVDMMCSLYGCSTKDIETAIGPSIGSCCFEVGKDVYDEFNAILDWSENFCIKKSNGKWHINLQEIIKKTLLNAGIVEEKISLSGICTKCNNDLFFSHRGNNGKTGSLAAIMQLL